MFLAFLQGRARDCQTLYILGDLFEAWLGDDDDSDDNARIIAGLRELADRGAALYLLHGNRDFLLGERFEASSGCRLLPDPCVIDLYGQPVVITHGDLLCTQDVEYQKVRLQIRASAWQAQFLALSLSQRAQLARQYRLESREKTSAKSEEIMDVEQCSVEQLMLENQVTQLIHGHTHRPAVHDFALQGHAAQRIVLGDWHEQGSVLYCNAQSGCELKAYA